MFRAKNNIGKVVAATLAIVATAPALTRAANAPVADAAAPDVAAADASATGTSAPAAADPTSEIVISAQKLNEARAGIETQTGASTYTIDSATIQAMPGGENTQLNQVILRGPRRRPGLFGQLHVRGEHNGLQYCFERSHPFPKASVSSPQTLDPHLIDSLVAGHRSAAGRVWIAHRGHHRPDHQERHFRSIRLGLALRRQSTTRSIRALLPAAWPAGAAELLRDRRLHAQQPQV